MIRFSILFVLLFSLSTSLITSCSSSSSGGEEPTMPTDDGPVAIPDPSAATLVFPEDNTECNQGEILSDIQSTVTFRWNESENTDEYQVNIINLISSLNIRVNVSENEAPVTIDRGTPYEWFVVSRANGTNETASSARFRFYNEGPGIENYAPFPAQAINPQRGATLAASTSLIDLEWQSSDVDNDISEYEVFFGTDADPPSLGTFSENSFTNLPVTSGTVYNWKVVTFDSFGNSSTSEIFQFRVN